jgi:hypothetical protein
MILMKCIRIPITENTVISFLGPVRLIRWITTIIAFSNSPMKDKKKYKLRLPMTGPACFHKTIRPSK